MDILGLIPTFLGTFLGAFFAFLFGIFKDNCDRKKEQNDSINHFFENLRNNQIALNKIFDRLDGNRFDDSNNINIILEQINNDLNCRLFPIQEEYHNLSIEIRKKFPDQNMKIKSIVNLQEELYRKQMRQYSVILDINTADGKVKEKLKNETKRLITLLERCKNEYEIVKDKLNIR